MRRGSGGISRGGGRRRPRGRRGHSRRCVQSRHLTIERKTVNDFVSEIDKRAERVIIETLSARFPDHAFKAEESGEAGASRYTWVIDPLDGTTNFLHGIPHYCVSIALRIDDAVVVGVVFDPTSGRLFTATRGQGAFLDGAPHPGQRPAGLERGRGRHRASVQGLAISRRLSGVAAGHHAALRRHPPPGAAALDLAYVAAGWTDGHWEKGLNAWDVAAGSLLVQEAGGVVSTFSGGATFLNSGQIVVGSAGRARRAASTC